MIDVLKLLFARDLNRLLNEIKLYSKEEAIWKTEQQIPNSAGNLCLHLIGNLNTYIGKEIGHTGYLRNREAEFTEKNVPRTLLLEKITETMAIITATLDTLDDKALEAEYPVLVFDQPTSTGHLLLHLATHLAYHLGQINYHRRLLDTTPIFSSNDA